MAVTNGAELVKLLRESGTPKEFLQPAREKLVEIYEKEKRVASAMEVGKALEDALGEHHGTVLKAASLVQTGELPSTNKQKLEQAEDRLLAGGTPGLTYEEMQSIEPKHKETGDASVGADERKVVKEKSVGPVVNETAATATKEKAVGPTPTTKK